MNPVQFGFVNPTARPRKADEGFGSLGDSDWERECIDTAFELPSWREACVFAQRQHDSIGIFVGVAPNGDGGFIFVSRSSGDDEGIRRDKSFVRGQRQGKPAAGGDIISAERDNNSLCAGAFDENSGVLIGGSEVNRAVCISVIILDDESEGFMNEEPSSREVRAPGERDNNFPVLFDDIGIIGGGERDFSGAFPDCESIGGTGRGKRNKAAVAARDGDINVKGIGRGAGRGAGRGTGCDEVDVDAFAFAHGVSHAVGEGNAGICRHNVDGVG